MGGRGELYATRTTVIFALINFLLLELCFQLSPLYLAVNANTTFVLP